MRKHGIGIGVAFVALVLTSAWFVPAADGGDCLTCGGAMVPDPGGGPPRIHHICLDFGGYTGYSQCYECVNCNWCIMMWRCYWP